MYIIIYVNRKPNKEEINGIESREFSWCQIVSSGAFEGPLHNFSSPEYDEDNNVVLFQCDLGSMDIVKGFDLLQNVCEGCNKYIFREELIKSIEITSELGIEFL